MGPEPIKLPGHPKFSWDMKTTLWTDVKGDQGEYYDAVIIWKAFLHAIPDINSNKLLQTLQVICLKSQLFSRSKDLYSVISNDQLLGDDGVQLIIDWIYKRGSLTVVS